MDSELKHVYCYQVGSSNCYKVGRTKNPPEKRMHEFATGSPEKLTLHRDIETENPSYLETYIHQFLDLKRAENGEFFRVTAQELDDAVDQAVAFMERFQPLLHEAREFREKKPNDTVAEPPDEIIEIYQQLRKLIREKFLVEQQIAFLKSKIQVAIGDNRGMKGVASWEWVDVWRLDVARFKREQEALYEQYKCDSSRRRFLLERVDLTESDQPNCVMNEANT